MRNLKVLGASVALSLGSIGSAFSAVPAAFTTAVTDMSADGASMGGALVGVAAVVGVALLAVAYVKKIRGAAK